MRKTFWTKTGWIRLAVVGMAIFGGAAFAANPVASPQSPGPAAALGQIQPGQWQLREPDSTAQPRLLCLVDADRLIQLQHPGMACARILVDDLPRTATVNYACPGAGHGRTMIHIETRNSFHLETQGIAGGAPFDMTFEARRLGDCAAPPR